MAFWCANWGSVPNPSPSRIDTQGALFFLGILFLLAGLLRCGKSCRLRWTNYLRPDLKRGLLSDYEEKMVIDLHAQLGNRYTNFTFKTALLISRFPLHPRLRHSLSLSLII
ncbi:hypothetical protein DS421_1g17720 [Arachis hypogaea]|nr:hypothetical protein DS421_1g17720 [Arachis hypogaea]